MYLGQLTLATAANLRIFVGLPSAVARSRAGNFEWPPRGQHGMLW
jgi:hypothetical protein